MQQNQAQQLIDRIIEEQHTGEDVIFPSPKGMLLYTVTAASCRNVLDTYLQLSEYGRRKLIDRYENNPAGLVVFCDRLVRNFEKPSQWNHVFQTTFEECIPYYSH